MKSRSFESGPREPQEPALPEASREKKSPEAPEIEKTTLELKEIFDTWLVPEKLEPLTALETEAEAMASPLRVEAKLALAEITKRIGVLEPSVSSDEIDALKAKYKILARAVGMINSGRVDHTR